MSDEKPDKPSTSTSTVPLRKETVRISLRAPAEDSGPVAPKGSTAPIPADGPTTDPVAGTPPSDENIDATAPLPADGPSTAPIAGSAPAPPPAPKPPSAPAPPPSAGGVPSAPPTAPPTAPPGAKTIPLSKAPDPLGPTTPVSTGGGGDLDPLGPTKPVPTAAGAAAASPVGAKTIPLAKAPGGGGAGAVGKATTPLKQGGAKPLPQATVKMGETQAMGGDAATKTISKKPNIQSTAEDAEEEWEEEYEESGLMPFAIIVLILSLAVLAIELVTKMGAGG